MIHVFIGTKAQMIKMAPIIKDLDNRRIPYNYIDTGQHTKITAKLRKQFGLKSPDVKLRQGCENIKTFYQALHWTISTLWQIIFKKNEIFKKYFRKLDGVCLIHGDTLTTLFSLMYAKRCGLKVAHVEAGLRSFDILNPFPEELIRLIVMHYSDILFAPSEFARENLQNMGYSNKTVYIEGNTIEDALRYIRSQHTNPVEIADPYVLVTIHRVETIYSRRRMSKITSLLTLLTSKFRVIFILHDPTKHQLRKFGLMKLLREFDQIELLPLQPYFKFINLIEGAKFVITDGGSIQEETFFLNAPCLIMRKKTERQTGLGKNVVLSNFNDQKINEFLDSWEKYKSPVKPTLGNPSSNLVDFLLKVEGVSSKREGSYG